MTRALTVQQPWAWAIIHGGKLIENRSTGWSYRGPLAIHAGARWSDRGDHIIAALTGRNEPEEVYEYGAIIGVVDLVDVHPAAGCCPPWGEEQFVHGVTGKPVKVIHHLVLENPRPVDPIAIAGRLGLWRPPADVLAAL